MMGPEKISQTWEVSIITVNSDERKCFYLFAQATLLYIQYIVTLFP